LNLRKQKSKIPLPLIAKLAARNFEKLDFVKGHYTVPSWGWRHFFKRINFPYQLLFLAHLIIGLFSEAVAEELAEVSKVSGSAGKS
jgi:hypothetical protein